MDVKGAFDAIGNVLKEVGDRLANPFIFSFIVVFCFKNWWFFYLLLQTKVDPFEIQAYIKIYGFDYYYPIIAATIYTSLRSAPKIVLSSINEFINVQAENIGNAIRNWCLNIDSTTASKIESRYDAQIEKLNQKLVSADIEYDQMEELVIAGYKKKYECNDEDYFIVLLADPTLSVGDLAVTLSNDKNRAVKAVYNQSLNMAVEGLVVEKLGRYVLIQTFGYFRGDHNTIQVRKQELEHPWNRFFPSPYHAGGLETVNTAKIQGNNYQTLLFGLTDDSGQFFISKSAQITIESIKRLTLEGTGDDKVYKEYILKQDTKKTISH